MSDRKMPRAVLAVAVLIAIIYFATTRMVQNASAASLAATLLQPGAVCWHTDPSDWHCTDSSSNQMLAASGAVRSAEVTVTYVNGAKETYQLPAMTDAVFLSRNALTNFLLRHYRATSTKGSVGYNRLNAGKAKAVQAYIKAHAQ